MAKSSIVDKVADAVVRAEIAVVRTGRKAVAAINKRTSKKAIRKPVSKTKRAVRKLAKKTTNKAAKRARRR